MLIINMLALLCISNAQPKFSMVIYPPEGDSKTFTLDHEQQRTQIDETWVCEISEVFTSQVPDRNEMLYGRSIECRTNVGFGPKIFVGCTLQPDGLVHEQSARICLPSQYKQILVRLTCAE